MWERLLTKLLIGLVVHSCLVQVYTLVSDILWELFGLARGSGKVSMELTDGLDRVALYI